MEGPLAERLSEVTEKLAVSGYLLGETQRVCTYMRAVYVPLVILCMACTIDIACCLRLCMCTELIDS